MSNVNQSNVQLKVTKLIEDYKQPFDSDFWASYKALESLIGEEEYSKIKKNLIQSKKFNTSLLNTYNIQLDEFLLKKNEIQEAWLKKSQEACERGKEIHSLLETGSPELKKLGIGGSINFIKENIINPEINGVYCELPLIYKDPLNRFELKGIADLVIIENFNVIIVDYKTGSEIKKGSYFNQALKKRQTMQYPLNHIQDCNFWHYTLQLSFYAWMLQKIDPRLKIKQLIILHIDHKNKEHLYECEYLKDTIDKLLTYHQQKLNINSKYAKLKPIEY